jgi:hypothetical protein
MVAVTADFLFIRWDLEYFCVGRGFGSPELYSVGQAWLEYSFIDEELVVCREV